jgi:N,N'-diacetyllegionaminate synthase
MSTYVIAEAGVNHNGDVSTALELVDRAKESGADAIKFQTFITDDIVTKGAKKAGYQLLQTGGRETQFEMLKKLELSQDSFLSIGEHCKKNGIVFLSTAFDLESLDFLDKQLDVPLFKIPSGEITNLPLLMSIATRGKPVILSTGMSTIDEIRDAYIVLQENGAAEMSLLQCTTEYPAPKNEVNLNVMTTLKKEFHCRVGISDHTEGIEIAIAAVALGADIIEKHFTLDKNMEGPDHKASLEPNELFAMVKAIRNVEMAIGDGVKTVGSSECKNRDIARKSIVASKTIKEGDVFSEDNIASKRPGNGMSPMKWFEVLGRIAQREYEQDDQIDISALRD